jgi:hypothetical protein
MTEAEWWGTTDPTPIIDWVYNDTPAADRKLRLLACAFCRRADLPHPGEAFARVLDLSEAIADGAPRGSELGDAWAGANRRLPPPPQSDDDVIPRLSAYGLHRAILTLVGWYPARLGSFTRGPHRKLYLWHQEPCLHRVAGAAAWAGHSSYMPEDVEARGREKERQTRLLHDIFGPLPFRDIASDTDWLTSTVVALARGIYDEKAFDRLPILADALEDAGCANDEILSHCRSADWEHVRGCWVVDLLLRRPWQG